MNKVLILFTGLFTLLSSTVWAQTNQTLYNMNTLPQVMKINPSSSPDCNMFIGIPALSSIYLNLNTGGLNKGVIDAAFVPEQGSDSFTFDITKLAEVFDANAYMQFGLDYELLSFGIKVGKGYYTFSASEKLKMRLDVPHDLFKLVFEGNGGENLGKSFNLFAGLDILHTREYAFGYQRSLLNDRLRVGGRLKYVYGLNAVQMERNDLQFRTAETDFTLYLKSDLKINLASSFLPMDTSEDVKAQKIIYGAKNYGWGMDLGASFDLNDKISISASVLDLGVITWKENTRNFVSRNPGAEFEFRGLDLNEFYNDSVDFKEGMKELGDSLIETFRLDTTENTFKTGLLSEFYIGGNYKLNEKQNLGILFYGSFYNKKFYPSATLSWNAKLSKAFALSVSYTAMKSFYGSLGCGLSLNLGSFQYYLISDNLLGVVIADVRNIGLRTGFNLTFNRTKEETVEKKVIEESSQLYRGLGY